MAKYDLENLLDAVKTFLQANLNAQINALNTEKGDTITLKQVDTSAYHLQYPEDRAELNDPFIVYEEAQEPIIKDIGGGQIATQHHIGVTIVLADNGLDPNIVTRLFRYRRVLLDLFTANWASIAKSQKFAVEAWSPTPPFKDEEKGFTGRAVGIVLGTVLTD